MIGLRSAIKKFKFHYWQSHKVADRYHSLTLDENTYLSYVTNRYLNLLCEKLKCGDSLLDLGAGTGVLTRNLIRRGFHVTALDISSEMLSKLATSCKSTNLTIIRGSIFDLCNIFAEKKFDAIATRWVIPHFPNWIKIVENASKVIAKNGYFLFDIGCSRNYELANNDSCLDLSSFGYNPKNELPEKNFYASTSKSELFSVASAFNFKVLKIENLSFFSQNALIASATPGYGFSVYKEKFDEYYKNNNVKEFINWFESFVTPGLPTGLTNSYSVLLQKN